MGYCILNFNYHYTPNYTLTINYHHIRNCNFQHSLNCYYHNTSNSSFNYKSHHTPNVPLTVIITIPTTAFLVVVLSAQLYHIITTPPLSNYNTYSLHIQYMFLIVSAYICIIYDSLQPSFLFLTVSANIYFSMTLSPACRTVSHHPNIHLFFYDTVSILSGCFSPFQHIFMYFINMSLACLIVSHHLSIHLYTL